MSSAFRIFLAAFAAILLFSMQAGFGQFTEPSPSFPSQDAKDVLQFSKRKMGNMLARRGKGLQEHVITDSMDGQRIVVIEGIPRSVAVVDAETLGVVRHYSVHAPLIAATQGLLSGTRPFMEPTEFERKEFHDLTGAMFTTTTFPPADLLMGLTEDSPYIDFSLPPQTPVLKISEGNYLIPLQQRYPEWIRAAYREFKRMGGIPLASLKPIFDRIDEDGGLRDADLIPIKVVHCHGCP